jgi:hypothetical protein
LLALIAEAGLPAGLPNAQSDTDDLQPCRHCRAELHVQVLVQERFHGGGHACAKVTERQTSAVPTKPWIKPSLINIPMMMRSRGAQHANITPAFDYDRPESIVNDESAHQSALHHY